jgi:phage tail sheath protein FI
MPTYLTPGVYVEELAGPRTIEGVSTSTAAFVGPCRFGPTSGRPELLTSYLDFARIYGDLNTLEPDGSETPNYLALGVKGFFDEGGSSLYVGRLFSFTDETVPTDDHAWLALPTSGSHPPAALTVRARFPGLAGRMMVTFTLRAGRNCLVGSGLTANLTRVHEFDSVWAVGSGGQGVYVTRRNLGTGAWTLAGNGGVAMPLATLTAAYPITVLVEVRWPSVDSQGLPTFGPAQTVGEFGFDPRAAGGGVSTILAANPPTRALALTVPIALEGVDGLGGVSIPADDLPTLIAESLLGDAILATASSATTPVAQREVTVTLGGGSDGRTLTSADYEASSSTFTDYQGDPMALPQRGLPGLESIDDISIVAAPGATALPADSPQAINNALITHCENMLYRVASLDTPPGLLPDDALAFRNLRSSEYAALYYPWLVIPNPADGTRLSVPPAAYMAGVWARSDNEIGVIKAPANEVVRSAIDLDIRLNKAQQALLNPEGVNCVRFFPGPGFLVWGARTISDDPEWKYLSMRRYFNYVEKSIDEGTQWVVFEVNGPALWDSVRHTVEGFLLNEWKGGALLGTKPAEAYFVRCDASTMTQNDLDNGRLICRIGIAAAKPAEFVIFRISQWTATATA